MNDGRRHTPEHDRKVGNLRAEPAYQEKRDTAIRQLTATTEHLRNARGGMRLIRDEEEVQRLQRGDERHSEVHALMDDAIAATNGALTDVEVALEILRAAVRAEA